MLTGLLAEPLQPLYPSLSKDLPRHENRCDLLAGSAGQMKAGERFQVEKADKGTIEGIPVAARRDSSRNDDLR